MAHHPFSPSKLARLESCPGSHALSQDVPHTASPNADEGTSLHEIVAAGTLPEGLTEEHKDLIERCRAFMDVLKERHPEVKTWSHEIPVKLTHNFEVITSGTADLVGYAPTYVVVVDWKFGHKEVAPAETNIQVRTYAASVMQACKMPRAHLYIFHARKGRHSEAEMDMRDYEATLIRVNSIRSLIFDGSSLVFSPSESACEYCPAKAICPALKRQAGDLAKVHSSQLSDPEAMGRLLSFAKQVKKWAESVEYHARQLALRSGGLPGYHLRARRGTRGITDAQKAYDILSAHMTPTEFMEACSVEVGTLENIFIKKRKAEDPKLTLAKAKGEFEVLLLPVIERGQDTQTLVAS